MNKDVSSKMVVATATFSGWENHLYRSRHWADILYHWLRKRNEIIIICTECTAVITKQNKL